MGSPLSPTVTIPLLQVSLLVSCHGNLNHTKSRLQTRELSSLTLVIEEGPDGDVVHEWRPVSEVRMSGTTAPPMPIVLVNGRRRDCDQEQIDCHRNCMKSKLSAPLNYIPRGDPRHNQICRDRCLSFYMDCVDAEKTRSQRFSAVDDAVAWLKEHQAQLLVGTVVVISGVTFVVVSAGAGLVVLAPLTLMATWDGAEVPCASGGWQ